MDKPATPPPGIDPRRIVTATGAVVSKPDLRPGDTVLVWSHPVRPATRTTGQHIGPPPPGTTDASPDPCRIDASVTEAVVVRAFAHWHTAAANRGIHIGCPVVRHPDPSSPLDETLDVAMTRQDLINALALTHIDIEAEHPIGLDQHACPMTDEQQERHGDQTLKMAYRLAATPAPADPEHIGAAAELALTNALMGWRQIGQPVHITTLRRIARQTGTVPDPAITRSLQHEAGDLIDITAGHHPHTGAPGHAVARYHTSRTPARIIEISAAWLHQIRQRDHFPGIQIHDHGHTVMMAMTGPDLETAANLAALDASISDTHNPPDPEADNPHLTRRQRRAITAYNDLKRQQTRNAAPETAAACLDYTTATTAITTTATQNKTPIDLSL